VTKSGEEDVISDSGGLGCVQHGTHFHCPPGVSAGCDALDLGPYDLAVHIAAVFVLLAASAIGVFTPVIFGNSAKPFLLNIFFVLKHFGTGVIISTA
jgi:zinc transporter 1/2/3